MHHRGETTRTRRAERARGAEMDALLSSIQLHLPHVPTEGTPVITRSLEMPREA